VPYLKDTYGFAQHNPHHEFDVFEHTIRAVASTEKDLITRLALLFHDIGKPYTFSIDKNGIGHFYSHALKSEELAKDAMTALRFDNRTIDAVLPLVRHHGDELYADKKVLRRRLATLGEDGLRRLIAVKTADALACYTHSTPPDYTDILKVLDEILTENSCLRVTDLNMNGHDLIALGYPIGREIGIILNAVLDAVINEDCANEHEALIAYVKERWTP